MIDTGSLLALGRKPRLLTLALHHYADRLSVSDVVCNEIKYFADLRHRAPGQMTRLGLAADAVMPHIRGRRIEILETPESMDDMLDAVLVQLRALDAARPVIGESSPVPSTRHHAGEASSIVLAVATRTAGNLCTFVTNDGGASLVAESRGVAVKHIGHVLAELACANPTLKAADLLQDYHEMTAGIGTPPSDATPGDASFFQCHAVDSDCLVCAVKEPDDVG